MYFLEQLINGLCQGMIYALMAIGYSLIAGVTGLVTFAYGEVAMIGAFAAYASFAFLGNSIFTALVMGFVIAGLLGIVIHRVAYEKFLDSPKYISLICTIGMSMLIRNFVQVIAGSETKGMPQVFNNSYIELGTIRIGYIKILIFCIVIVISLGLTVFLSKTKIGMALRSVSQDRKAAALVGIDIKKITMLGNSIGCAFGGIAGVMLALYYSNVSAIMGGAVGLKAFSSAVLGGLTNVGGAAFSGVLIGVCENFGIMFMSSGLRDVIAFVFLILVLLLKPEGLFGQKGEAKI